MIGKLAHLKFITKIKRAQSMTMIMKQRLSENFGSRIACEASGLWFFCLHYNSHFSFVRNNIETIVDYLDTFSLSYNINN